jgi:hypothetical protein
VLWFFRVFCCSWGVCFTLTDLSVGFGWSVWWLVFYLLCVALLGVVCGAEVKVVGEAVS